MGDLRDRAHVQLYLDDAEEPFAIHAPPARVTIDTTLLADGPHRLRIVARDTIGSIGRREIPFIVQNGPGITVTGLRANTRVAGTLEVDVNAFSANEPFDPLRAESSAAIPVWTWVGAALIAAWAGWYGLSYFAVPEAFASTPTYAAHPTAFDQASISAANASAPSYSGKGAAGGFDYGATGGALYTQNCSACHGAGGAGVPGAFPALAGDPVVSAANPHDHITTVLHGLANKVIGGKSYSAQMPAFSQLSNQDIAAIVDHERTSWGNKAPIVTPDDVRRAR
jgi:mono/diheme cytochrome c family protein